MRKLRIILLLPLLSLPLRVTADLRARIGEASPRDLLRGDLGRSITKLLRRCLRAPRRLLTHSATAPEIHVITAKAHAETTTAAPSGRRRATRRLTPRVLTAAPRVRPQTT